MKKIQMQGVPETMLQILYARVAYSKKRKAKFYDNKAVEIMSRMDYDFSLAEKDAMMSKGIIARTILLDRMVGDFIRENPKGTAVNIACGLYTRKNEPADVSVRASIWNYKTNHGSRLFPAKRDMHWFVEGAIIYCPKQGNISLHAYAIL